MTRNAGAPLGALLLAALAASVSMGGMYYVVASNRAHSAEQHRQVMSRIEAARVSRLAEREGLKPICESYFEYTKLPGMERVPGMERTCGFMWEDDK